MNMGRRQLVYSMVKPNEVSTNNLLFRNIYEDPKETVCSYLKNALENSSVDLTVYINKFCCIWRKAWGNEASSEY